MAAHISTFLCGPWPRIIILPFIFRFPCLVFSSSPFASNGITGVFVLLQPFRGQFSFEVLLWIFLSPFFSLYPVVHRRFPSEEWVMIPFFSLSRCSTKYTTKCHLLIVIVTMCVWANDRMNLLSSSGELFRKFSYSFSMLVFPLWLCVCGCECVYLKLWLVFTTSMQRERASSRKYTFTFVYLFIFFFCRFRFLFCAVAVAAAFVVVDAVCLFGSVCFVEMGVRQTYTIEILFSMLLSRFNSKYIGIENGRKFSSLYALIAIGFTHQMVMLIW